MHQPLSLAERLNRHTKRVPSGCHEWQAAKHHSGYGVTARRIDGKNISMPAHRAAYEVAYGPIPSGLFVCHKCDNPICVNPAHLFLGTARDNAHDRRDKGRNGTRRTTGFSTNPPRGAKNIHAKLTESQVLWLRRQYDAGRLNQAAAARRLGVNASMVQRIVKRVHWKHLP